MSAPLTPADLPILGTPHRTGQAVREWQRWVTGALALLAAVIARLAPWLLLSTVVIMAGLLVGGVTVAAAARLVHRLRGRGLVRS